MGWQGGGNTRGFGRATGTAHGQERKGGTQSVRKVAQQEKKACMGWQLMQAGRSCKPHGGGAKRRGAHESSTAGRAEGLGREMGSHGSRALSG